MTKPTKNSRMNSVAPSIGLNEMLDTLLACDLAVVEFSMGLYNVPRREQAAIREQNLRLHGALRKNLLPSCRSRKRIS